MSEQTPNSFGLDPLDGSLSYRDVVNRLAVAYDGSAAERDSRPRADWKVGLRDKFLARLQSEGKLHLVELGSGPGHDSLFFQRAGMTVTAIDPSPEMVRYCRDKGLNAQRGDFLTPRLPAGAAEGAWAMNSLLHVPNADLDAALASVRALLQPDGLFFFCVYGGTDEEGIDPHDSHQPPRFFSFRSDERLRVAVSRHFEIIAFEIVNEGSEQRSQALTLRCSNHAPGATS